MENFTDKQYWWVQELEAIAKTPDQISAIAMLRNLLQSYKEVSNSKATVVPEGWVLAPKEAEAGMLKAGEQAYLNKQNDMNSPTPTEFPWELGGPMGYAWDAMLKNIPYLPFVEPFSVESSSSVETILASLEELRKKFPENYVVGEIPGVPLKINGEDWVLEGHAALAGGYFLTKGTTESIKQAKRMRSDWRNTSSTYNDFFVHLRANGTLSNVSSNNPIPVVMSLGDMANAIRKMKA